VGQSTKVLTLKESLEHVLAFNPGINPISLVEAAVDDSLIQPDTERGIHKDRRLPTASSLLVCSRDEIPKCKCRRVCCLQSLIAILINYRE